MRKNASRVFARIVVFGIAVCSIFAVPAGSVAALGADTSASSGGAQAQESDLLRGAYEYYLEDGTLKYWLDLGGDDLKLHCFFREGDPEYREEVYSLPLQYASASCNTLIFGLVQNEGGYDITHQFSFFGITFTNQKAVLTAVRDECTLAGGTDSSIMTGCYEMSAKGNTEAGNCLPAILCRMAQAYYYRHNGFYPPVADFEDKKNGTYTIHLYEIVDEGTDSEHTATSAWLTVDAGGVGKDDLFGDEVNIRN